MQHHDADISLYLQYCIYCTKSYRNQTASLIPRSMDQSVVKQPVYLIISEMWHLSTSLCRMNVFVSLDSPHPQNTIFTLSTETWWNAPHYCLQSAQFPPLSVASVMWPDVLIKTTELFSMVVGGWSLSKLPQGERRGTPQTGCQSIAGLAYFLMIKRFCS